MDAYRTLTKMDDESEVSESVIQRMKIAVAMACLRSKPAGVSGRVYAQQLCDKFQTGQLQWKHKYDEAQTQMLHMRQQLALQQLTSVATQPVVLDASPSSSQSIFPTPPMSNQISSDTDITQGLSSLASHTAFLHHVISLQTASSIITDKNAHLDNLTTQSVLHSLDLLQVHLGKTDYSWRIQMQCVQSVGALLQKTDRQTRSALVEKVCTVCQHIIHQIISNQSVYHSIQDKQVKLLSAFSEKSCLTKPVLELLIVSIHTFSESLRAVVRTTERLDPCYFCNMYYILVAIENCLLGQLIRDWDEEFRDSVRMRLEDCLLHITEQFPLFAHAIWKLCAKIPEV